MQCIVLDEARYELLDVQIKKGVLDACVLHAVKDGESYGYKIISDLGGIIEISESTLYPILKRLEAGGFITSRTQEFNGRLRRYYKITRSGLTKLNEYKRDFEEINRLSIKIFGGKK